jgi:hypothetical protein
LVVVAIDYLLPVVRHTADESMANDAPSREVIPESSAGIIEALFVVRDGEAGHAQLDGHHER